MSIVIAIFVGLLIQSKCLSKALPEDEVRLTYDDFSREKLLRLSRSVRVLNLQGASIADRDLEILLDFPKLEQVNLSFTGVTDGVALLCKLKHLRWLSLTGCRKVTSDGLGPFESLEELYLEETGVDSSCFRKLKGCCELRILKLTRTGVSDENIDELKNLRKLTNLNLANTKITNSSLRVIPCLPQLRELDLSGTRITFESAGLLKLARKLNSLSAPMTIKADQWLGNLSALKQLRLLEGLRGSDISSAGFSRLSMFRKLEGVNLSGTSLDDNDVRYLGKTRLKWLSLDNTRVTDKGIVLLNKLSTLRFLSLAGTEVTGVCFNKGFVSLKDLTIRPKLTRDGLLDISRLSLTDLDLSMNRLCPSDGYFALSKMRGSIRTLALEDTPVDGRLVARLKELWRLERLYLNGTGMKAEDVQRLKELLPSTFVVWHN